MYYECRECELMRVETNVPLANCPRCGSSLDDITDIPIFFHMLSFGFKVRDSYDDAMAFARGGALKSHDEDLAPINDKPF